MKKQKKQPTPAPTLDQSIQEAKDYLRENFEIGVECPCCKQLVKLYKRRINNIMSRTLIRLYHLDQEQPIYHHVKDIVKDISDTGTNDFSKLSYWGLIEEKQKEPKETKTRTSGYWTITDLGKKFVTSQVDLPSYALVYNNRVLEFSKDKVNIEKSLGEKFNYKKLMSGK